MAFVLSVTSRSLDHPVPAHASPLNRESASQPSSPRHRLPRSCSVAPSPGGRSERAHRVFEVAGFDAFPDLKPTDRHAATTFPAGPIVKVTLRRPMGMVLEEDDETGDVYVAEVKPGGAADRSKNVFPGDRIRRISGTFITDRRLGRTQERLVNALGVKLETIMSAIESNASRPRSNNGGATTFEIEHPVDLS